MPQPHQNMTNACLCPHDALPLKLPEALAFSQKCVLSSWHCLLRQEQCCPHLWSWQSSFWIQTLFSMSLPGTCRKAAVTSKKSGWCCWKSQSGGPSAFRQGMCWWRAVPSCVSMLSLIVCHNTKSSNLFCYFWSRELEGSISSWSGNLKWISCIHPDLPLGMELPNCSLRVESSKLDLSGRSWSTVLEGLILEASCISLRFFFF